MVRFKICLEGGASGVWEVGGGPRPREESGKFRCCCCFKFLFFERERGGGDRILNGFHADSSEPDAMQGLKFRTQEIMTEPQAPCSSAVS